MTDKLWKGWKYWKNKTQLEEDAIDSMLKSKNYILKNIPKNEIVSIYVYGSFVKREMDKKSDLDIIVVLRSDNSLDFAEDTIDDAIKLSKIELDISAVSLNEIKQKKINKKKRKYLPPWFLLVLIPDNLYLIYGEEVFQNDFSEKNLEKRYIEDIKASISLYYSPEKFFYWKSLLKFLFQIIKIEHLIEEKSFVRKRESLDRLDRNSLDNFFEDKNHIIHKTVKYLESSPEEVGIKERKRFVKEAKKYIKSSHYWYYRKIKNKSAFYAWKKLLAEKTDPWIGYIGEKINKKSPKIYRLLKKIKLKKKGK